MRRCTASCTCVSSEGITGKNLIEREGEESERENEREERARGRREREGEASVLCERDTKLWHYFHYQLERRLLDFAHLFSLQMLHSHAAFSRALSPCSLRTKQRVYFHDLVDLINLR